MCVLIQVSGGVVQGVFCTSKHTDLYDDVFVVDYDDDSKDNPIVSKQIIERVDPECELLKDFKKWKNSI